MAEFKRQYYPETCPVKYKTRKKWYAGKLPAAKPLKLDPRDILKKYEILNNDSNSPI